jgi:hypothetical protein
LSSLLKRPVFGESTNESKGEANEVLELKNRLVINKLADLLREACEGASLAPQNGPVFYHEVAERLLRTQVGSDREELVTLRTGVARLAQRANIGGYIPGRPQAFEDIAKAADEHERGWNALIARLMDHIGDDRPREAHLVLRHIHFGTDVQTVILGWVADHEEGAAVVERLEHSSDSLLAAAKLLGATDVQHETVFLRRASFES